MNLGPAWLKHKQIFKYARQIQKFCEDLATPLVKERIHIVTNYRIKKKLLFLMMLVATRSFKTMFVSRR